MIGIGERSGSLREMLDEVAVFYDAESEVRLEQLTTTLEPAILVVMGGVVVTILLAIYLPIIQSISSGAGVTGASLISYEFMKQISENEDPVITPVPPAGENGQNGDEHQPPEMKAARELARRYRLPFVDLLPPDRESPIDYQLFTEVPVDLMVRHQFVPLKRDQKGLHIAMADPTDLERLDELSSTLRTRVVPHVATAGAVEVVLRKGDTTQRVLQEAASGFRISLVRETEHGEEVLDLDRLATDSEMSPIIKLVDTIIYNAMESRASDIHIETRDTEVQVKYRIDGALYAKVDPIDLAYHQTLISRIKVMSELDIAERRVPQDGRFRVRYKGRNVDFRVSIMPTIHGEDAVIRILDKEQINEEFQQSQFERRRFCRRGSAKVSPLHRGALRHGAGDWSNRFR